MSAATPRPSAVPSLAEIQAPVRAGLERVTEELRRIVAADFPLITEVNDHLLRMRGKMFRPTLTLLSSQVTDRPSPRAPTLAAVIELMHVATLVHDDAVDHSTLRRGMPTINALFSHQVSVIMGDYLYSKALGTLVKNGDMEPLRILTDVSTQMTIGEMRQLQQFDRLAFTEDDYHALNRAKTASLLSGACEIGAISGAERYRAELKRYGELLGMAFQVADDLLDYTADAAVTGKPTGLDLRERKVTLPLIAALRDMGLAARARVDALFAQETPDDASIAEVVAIVAESGGIEYARRRGEAFADEADAVLQALPETAARAALSDAITYVMERRW
ncbi:MAG: polyprenyl synthetase family protein [Gemmatimonadaceae bacterium]|nr:polyprenyl synthetase family protein [Gemmatimonadaceae bacterium]NUQ94680.1 polyprenyl synthetase family protein [Gemmatimonadaceae bacterium]NUR21159.1 polyprenyl synthetase family protein [Gemmatimonadaceae bacterium]NUS97059.1 polyprenyl synthetase family protein [Gemmatimonadaceae bacterium]